MASGKSEVTTSPRVENVEEEDKRIKEYWTEGRMREAQPLQMPIRSATRHPVGSKRPGRELETGFVTTKVTSTLDFPYKAIGKLFMTFGGSNFAGTAWTIGHSSIFTAGHCLHDRTNWATNVLFCPIYNHGVVFDLKFPCGDMVVLTKWIQDGTELHDQAAAVTLSPVAEKTGRLPTKDNINLNSGPYTQIGYAAVPIPDYPFDGEEMWQSIGDYVDDQDWVVRAWGNLTGGCSGGPWMIQTPDGLFVNGINAGSYVDDPDREVSPYFGNEFLDVVNQLKAWGVY